MEIHDYRVGQLALDPTGRLFNIAIVNGVTKQIGGKAGVMFNIDECQFPSNDTLDDVNDK